MNVIPYPSRGVKRSRLGRRRPRMSVQRIPRTVRYNGENKITRTVAGNVAFTKLGFGIGAGTSEALSMVFDPTQVTLYIAALTSVSFALPNAAELAALYDQVRIDKVEITWSSHAQAITGTAIPSNYSLPKFLVCNDDNDGIGVTTLAGVSQQPNKSFLSGDGKEMKWTCYPKYQRIVYLTSLVSNYEPARGFVNSDAAIPHYATKIAIANLPSLGATANGLVDFTCKFFLTLKNVK